MLYLKEAGADDLILQPTRHKSRANAKNEQDIANSLVQASAPVNIPHSIFLEPLFEQNQDMLSGKEIKDVNTAYLINLLFTHECGQEQEFYEYKREHEIFRKVDNIKNRDLKFLQNNVKYGMTFKDIKTELKRIPPFSENMGDKKKKDEYDGNIKNLKNCLNEMSNTERAIRRYRTQDMVMFLMAREILQKNAKGSLNFKLSDISPQSESAFASPVDFKFLVKLRFNENDTVQKQYTSHIKSCSVEHSAQGPRLLVDFCLASSQSKLKDFGKHRRFCFDRRLGGLLLWLGEREVDVNRVREEIERYDREKLEMAKAVYLLEKEVGDAHFASADQLVDFREIAEKLQELFPHKKDDIALLQRVRNAIFHNQIPMCKKELAGISGDLVAEKLLRFTQQVCEDLTSELALANERG